MSHKWELVQIIKYQKMHYWMCYQCGMNYYTQEFENPDSGYCKNASKNDDGLNDLENPFLVKKK